MKVINITFSLKWGIYWVTMLNIQARKKVFLQFKYKFGNEYRRQMISYLLPRKICFPNMFVLFTLEQDLPMSGAPHYRRFIFIFRTTAFGRTPLDEWSARHRYRFLTTHNTHKRKTFMHLAGFENTFPLSERRQINMLERRATRTGNGVC